MLLLFTLSAITQCTITAEWNDIKQRGSTLWSRLLLLLLPILLRPRTGSSSLHLFLYFLNEVTEDGFCLPVFLLFGRLLSVQRLGSLMLYRTAAGSGVWSRRLFRGRWRLHPSFIVAMYIIQCFGGLSSLYGQHLSGLRQLPRCRRVSGVSSGVLVRRSGSVGIGAGSSL
jgi:hypothetical protein